jgi:hypothetical protein
VAVRRNRDLGQRLRRIDVLEDGPEKLLAETSAVCVVGLLALAPPATTQFRLSAGAVKSAVLTLPVAAS